ncbi:MAG: hypothetical protein AAF446_05545 [Pseudomonadota bacterium]
MTIAHDQLAITGGIEFDKYGSTNGIRITALECFAAIKCNAENLNKSRRITRTNTGPTKNTARIGQPKIFNGEKSANAQNKHSSATITVDSQTRRSRTINPQIRYRYGWKMSTDGWISDQNSLAR